MNQIYTTEEIVNRNTEEINVLIVDDHPISSEGLANYLETDPNITVASVWQRGEDALEAISHNLPDLVIIDLELIGSQINGTELIRTLRQTYPHLKLMTLSVHFDQQHILGALEAGVNGYLLKNSSRVELINAVHIIMSGQTLFDPEVAKVLRLYTRNGPEDPSKTEPLTNREWEILSYLARGYSNRDIAGSLTIAPSTVKTHVKNIFAKLDLSNREQARVWYHMNIDQRAE